MMTRIAAAAIVAASYLVAPDLPPTGGGHRKPRESRFMRPKITTYAQKYLGRRTANGDRYTGGMTCAVNRLYLVGEYIRVYYRDRSIVLYANDRFDPAKDTLRCLKIDTSPRAMRALGLRGMTRVDSARVVDPE